MRRGRAHRLGAIGVRLAPRSVPGDPESMGDAHLIVEGQPHASPEYTDRPPCRLYIYRDGPALAFHVHDSGLGPSDPLAGYLPPADHAYNGRGLWIARQLCDALDITTNLSGTHVSALSLLP